MNPSALASGGSAGWDPNPGAREREHGHRGAGTNVRLVAGGPVPPHPVPSRFEAVEPVVNRAPGQPEGTRLRTPRPGGLDLSAVHTTKKTGSPGWTSSQAELKWQI